MNKMAGSYITSCFRILMNDSDYLIMPRTGKEFLPTNKMQGLIIFSQRNSYFPRKINYKLMVVYWKRVTSFVRD